MQNVGHAWSGTGKEVGTVSPGALNGLLLTWSRLRSFPGCGSFFLASRSDVEIADRWCRECPGDGARLRNKKAAEWDSGWSGAVDQSPWKSGSPWGKLWDDPPPPRSGSESGQEDQASPCRCGLSQPLRMVLVSQEGVCPGRVGPLQSKHEDAYCWH